MAMTDGLGVRMRRMVWRCSHLREPFWGSLSYGRTNLDFILVYENMAVAAPRWGPKYN